MAYSEVLIQQSFYLTKDGVLQKIIIFELLYYRLYRPTSVMTCDDQRTHKYL